MPNSHISKLDTRWKVHTSGLFAEIVEANPKEMAPLKRPINILKGLLVEVGERAVELNDPILNELMCRLTIYDVADPYSENYDPAVVDAVIAQANSHRECPAKPKFELSDSDVQRQLDEDLRRYGSVENPRYPVPTDEEWEQELRNHSQK